MPAILPFESSLPEVDPTAYVAPGASLVGRVRVGPDASIWYGCVLRGDVHDIHVGARTNIQDGSVLHGSSAGHRVWVGSGVTVGHGAVLHACTVEDDSFIGMRAVVLDGAHVCRGAMVAAGALVPPGRTVRPGELWAGTPAKFVRALSEQERAAIPQSAARYVELARRHALAGHPIPVPSPTPA